MKINTMKTAARVALMVGALLFFACAAYALATGWEARMAYPEQAGTGGTPGVSVFVMEFSPAALGFTVLSLAASLLCASLLATGEIARRRRTYLLKDTISQCKEYVHRNAKLGFRNNLLFFL